jgi:hypothetical protein
MPGEGNFTTTEEDLVAANRLHARQLWNWRAVVRGWVLGTIALALVAIWLCGRVDWKMLWVPLIAAGYMAVGAIVAQLTFSHFARRHYRQARSFWHPTTLYWDSDSIRFASDRGDVRFNWTDFFSWAADERSILLYQSANYFYTIPTRDLDAEARTDIAAALKNAGVVERSSR